jgi:hypothetical protein
MELTKEYWPGTFPKINKFIHLISMVEAILNELFAQFHQTSRLIFKKNKLK